MNISLLYKKILKRGVAMTEYAVLLAFIVVVSTSFVGNDGLQQSIGGAIDKAVAAITGVGQVSSENLLANMELGFSTWHNGIVNNSTKPGDEKKFLHSNIIAIEPNTTYELKVDMSKLALPDSKPFELGFFTTNDSGLFKEGGVYTGIDSFWIDPTKTADRSHDKGYSTVYDPDTQTATVTFTSKEGNTKFAMNFHQKSDPKTFTSIPGIQDSIKQAITLTKKQQN